MTLLWFSHYPLSRFITRRPGRPESSLLWLGAWIKNIALLYIHRHRCKAERWAPRHRCSIFVSHETNGRWKPKGNEIISHFRAAISLSAPVWHRTRDSTMFRWFFSLLNWYKRGAAKRYFKSGNVAVQPVMRLQYCGRSGEATAYRGHKNNKEESHAASEKRAEQVYKVAFNHWWNMFGR